MLLPRQGDLDEATRILAEVRDTVPDEAFYNLEPGLYFLYAEYVDADGITYTATGSVSVTQDVRAIRSLTLDF